jgi:hypothetical protein
MSRDSIPQPEASQSANWAISEYCGRTGTRQLNVVAKISRWSRTDDRRVDSLFTCDCAIVRAEHPQFQKLDLLMMQVLITESSLVFWSFPGSLSWTRKTMTQF